MPMKIDTMGTEASTVIDDEFATTTPPVADSPRLFVRLNRSIYPEVQNYLTREQGFADIPLLDDDYNPLSTVGRSGSVVKSLIAFFRNMNAIRTAEVIVAAPKNVHTILRVFGMFGLIKAKRNYCYGFFSHSTKPLTLFRWLAKFSHERDSYIVFSQAEARLYSKAMRLSQDHMFVLPYSDWDESWEDSDDPPLIDNNKSERYFFSGGYSNRDYAALVDVFRKLPHEKLIIVCSAINHDVDRIKLPPNVTVHRDLPLKRFNDLIAKATGCVLPIKNKSGPAGQSVLVAALKFGTPVIINDTPVIREYIEDGVTGYLVRHMTDVPAILAKIDPNSETYKKMVLTGHKVYHDTCSFAAVTHRIDMMLREGETERATA